MAGYPGERTGFIGLGIMGLGMADNLIKGGRKLLVWNRSVDKSKEFAAKYDAGVVEIASSAGAVIAGCAMTYSMLSTLDASKAVFPSVLESMAEGKMIVDCATLTPEHMAEMASAVTAKKGAFLEAPVSGSKKPAADGQLIFLCAGSKSVLDAAKTDLDLMGKATHYFGEDVGGGSKMKLCVNMTMGIQCAAIAEGAALCSASGLDASKFVEVLGQGAMASGLVSMKGPCMVKREYPANFPLMHAQKDMRFAVNLGDELGMDLPVAAASNELYKRARSMNKGEEDFCAVFEASRKSDA